VNRRREAELLRRLGPTESWVLPADEIEQVARTATCRHGKLPVTACNDCFVSALLRRQVTLLAERLGCKPDVAQDVSDNLCNEFLEEPRR
jgi:hypothetical protein